MEVSPTRNQSVPQGAQFPLSRAVLTHATGALYGASVNRVGAFISALDGAVSAWMECRTEVRDCIFDRVHPGGGRLQPASLRRRDEAQAGLRAPGAGRLGRYPLLSIAVGKETIKAREFVTARVFTMPPEKPLIIPVHGATIREGVTDRDERVTRIQTSGHEDVVGVKTWNYQVQDSGG